MIRKCNSKNEVCLMGYLGSDPDKKNKCVLLALATTESFKKQNVPISESTRKDFQLYETKTSWHNIMIVGDYLIKETETLKKGDKIEIRGKISYGEYINKDNITIKTTTILVDSFTGRLLLIEQGKDKGTNSQESAEEFDDMIGEFDDFLDF